MAQAIITKYLGPTNHRGGRVRAQAAGGAYLVQAWDYGRNQDGNHDDAAKELAIQLGWRGVWLRGDLADGAVYVCATASLDLEQPTVRALHSVSAFVVENDQPVGQCRTVPLRGVGYDRGGAYWGERPPGLQLFVAYTRDATWWREAPTYLAVQEAIRRRVPAARFEGGH